MATISSNAWTSLANAKEYLQIATATTTYDDLLINLINRSETILERYCGRKMKSRSYTEYYDGDGTRFLYTKQWPIVSITSIHIDVDRVFGSAELVSSSDYFFDDENGEVQGRITLLGTADESIFGQGYGNVKLVYTAGYATLPEDIEAAAVVHVSHWYNKAGTEGHTSMGLGGLSKSFDMAPLPGEVKMYLEPHRKRPV